MLGIRGRDYAANLCGPVEFINGFCRSWGEAEIFQSNHEGAIVDKYRRLSEIRRHCDKSAAYTHTSVAILDAVKR